MTAVLLKEQEPIVSTKGFLSTYSEPEGTYATRAREFLQGRGLLPLEYLSPLFPQLKYSGFCYYLGRLYYSL